MAGAGAAAGRCLLNRRSTTWGRLGAVDLCTRSGRGRDERNMGLPPAVRSPCCSYNSVKVFSYIRRLLAAPQPRAWVFLVGRALPRTTGVQNTELLYTSLFPAVSHSRDISLARQRLSAAQSPGAPELVMARGKSASSPSQPPPKRGAAPQKGAAAAAAAPSSEAVRTKSRSPARPQAQRAARAANDEVVRSKGGLSPTVYVKLALGAMWLVLSTRCVRDLLPGRSGQSHRNPHNVHSPHFTATSSLHRPAFAAFLPILPPAFLVVMGVQASLPGSTGAPALPQRWWWQTLSGAVWGTLLCLSVLLVAQAVADTLPDSISGLYSVSQVMVRVDHARVARPGSTLVQFQRRPQPFTLGSPLPLRLTQDHASEDRLRRLVDVVAIATFLAEGAVKRRELGLSLMADTLPTRPVDPRAAQEARAMVMTLLTGALWHVLRRYGTLSPLVRSATAVLSLCCQSLAGVGSSHKKSSPCPRLLTPRSRLCRGVPRHLRCAQLAVRTRRLRQPLLVAALVSLLKSDAPPAASLFPSSYLSLAGAPLRNCKA